MSTEANRRVDDLGRIKIEVYEIMTLEVTRKIKNLSLKIFVPVDLNSNNY